MWEFSPKTVRIWNFGINLPVGGDSFVVFLRNSQRLYESAGSF